MISSLSCSICCSIPVPNLSSVNKARLSVALLFPFSSGRVTVEFNQATVKEKPNQATVKEKLNQATVKMGLHSYSQPSSSDPYAYDPSEVSIQPSESSHNNYAEREAELGIPKECYCGAEPILDTMYTRNDPGRKFFSCPNRDDGECHIFKWWDVAVMQEMRAAQTNYAKVTSKVHALTHCETELHQIKQFGNETDEKLNKLEKLVAELDKKNSGLTFSLELILAVLLILVAILGMIVFKLV